MRLYLFYSIYLLYRRKTKKKSERFDLGEGERREGVNDGCVIIERDEMME
jgi:hypothetical protein